MRANRASRLSRLGTASAVVILASGGVLATATVASAAAAHAKLSATTLSIKNKPIAHGKHHADAISGVLRSHHNGVAGETVTLDSRTGKKPPWAVAGTGTSGASLTEPRGLVLLPQLVAAACQISGLCGVTS
jgi:hypothetical protein